MADAAEFTSDQLDKLVDRLDQLDLTGDEQAVLAAVLELARRQITAEELVADIGYGQGASQRTAACQGLSRGFAGAFQMGGRVIIDGARPGAPGLTSDGGPRK
jgi:predicted esterase